MENKLHPELINIYSMLPQTPLKNGKIDFRKLREVESYDAIPNTESNTKIETIEKMIPGKDGDPDVRISVIRPKKQTEVLPGLYYIHGGGYIAGKPEHFKTFYEHYVAEFNCVAVIVNYRLAPENPYPAAIEDCYAGLKWFSENAEELKVNPDRIITVGTSAGGGLVSALSLLARDRKGPKIAYQFPIYPMIDNSCSTSSNNEITDFRVWNGISNKSAWEMYLGDLKNQKDIPIYAAASRAEDLSNLPPTYTFVGDLDPFRDETINYVQKLRQHGVSAEFHLYPGGFHGFEVLAPQTEFSKRVNGDLERAIKNALYPVE